MNADYGDMRSPRSPAAPRAAQWRQPLGPVFAPRFAQDVRPLFRDKDRDSMRSAFDLFHYSDVADHADAILGALRSGKMPCDGAWSAEMVATFQRWIDAGKRR